MATKKIYNHVHMKYKQFAVFPVGMNYRPLGLNVVVTYYSRVPWVHSEWVEKVCY